VELAKSIDSGCAVVNDCMITYGIPEAPFGGTKASGIGRVNGEIGLKGYCHVQSIVVDRFGGRSEPLWFPYDARKARWLRRALRLGDTARTLALVRSGHGRAGGGGGCA